MLHRQLLIGGFVAIAAAGALCGPALAGTARASDRISVFSGPHAEANTVVGILYAGEQVSIDRCTPSGEWCRVFADRATGWVPASYLIGAAAKIDATPLRSLTDPPVDQLNDLGHPKPRFF